MPVLDKTTATIFAVVLAALEVVQQTWLHATGGVHDSITLAILVIAGLGIAPATPDAIRKLVPVHVAVILTAIVGVADVIQRTQLDLTAGWHGFLGGFLTLLAAAGFSPVTVDHPVNVRRAAVRRPVPPRR